MDFVMIGSDIGHSNNNKKLILVKKTKLYFLMIPFIFIFYSLSKNSLDYLNNN